HLQVAGDVSEANVATHGVDAAVAVEVTVDAHVAGGSVRLETGERALEGRVAGRGRDLDAASGRHARVHLERAVEVLEEAGEGLRLGGDEEPVADELDRRRVDELLRAAQDDGRFAAVGGLDLDVADPDLDLEPEGPGSGEGLLLHGETPFSCGRSR